MESKMSAINNFALWLDSRWDALLEHPHTNIDYCIGRTRRFLIDLHRGVIDTDDLPLADFLCRLGFVSNGWRHGPWSFMDDQEWNTVKVLMDDECLERDAQGWLF